MPASSQLSIFPSPSKHQNPNVRQPQLRDVAHSSTELHGLALHFKAVQSTPPKIQQATNRVQHVASGETRSSPGSVTRASRQQLKNKRSSSANLNTLEEGATQQSFIIDTQTSEKPVLRSALKTRASGLTSRSSLQSLSTTVSTTSSKLASDLVETPATDYSRCSVDRKYEMAGGGPTDLTRQSSISRDGASSAPPRRTSRTFPPRSHSLRSGRSTASEVDNTSHVVNRSIFPQYDMSKPLSQQRYQPREAALPIVVPEAAKIDSPPKAPARNDSGIVIPNTYECVPEPDSEDVHAIWRASTRLGACEGRKVQLSFNQSQGLDRAYTISQGPHKLFSARLDPLDAKSSAMQLSLDKVDPSSQETQLLANITLPPMSSMRSQDAACSTPIFPQQAAIDALAAASNSPRARSIALFDPKASSKAAEALATEVVAESRRSYSSGLIRTSCTRDNVGTVSAKYVLEHPIAGDLPITVERSVPINRIYTCQTPQMKVSIHHPSATNADISEDDLCLAWFDFARKACVLDLPAILALDAEYMLDTIIAALFGAAAMESEHTLQQAMTFAAPPSNAVKQVNKKRSFLHRSKRSEKSQPSGVWPLRKTGVREIDEPVEEMPSFAKGTLAILELGINGAFWALEKGFKSLDERATARR